jgi:hypothetical protein
MAKVAGSIWVEGNDLHYVDQFGREWYCPGYGVKAVTGAKPGSIWIEPSNHYLYYVNEWGTGIYYPYPWGDAFSPINVRTGSLWVDTRDNQLHWITDHDGSVKHNVRAHYDIAAQNAHTDTHADGIHTDFHSDVPGGSSHSDVNHDDWHNDWPHSDHTDQSHTDVPHTDTGKQFNDHGDCYGTAQLIFQDKFTSPDTYWTTNHIDCWTTNREHHEDLSHSDGPSPHFDYWGGNNPHTDIVVHHDIAHNDIQHQDTHGDSAHQDTPAGNWHQDIPHQDAHTDQPHQDIAHQDTPHSDAHTDSHADVVHIDEPYYIGP